MTPAAPANASGADVHAARGGDPEPRGSARASVMGFSLTLRAEADRAWLAGAIEAALGQAAKGRRSHIRVPLPVSAGGGEAMVKVYPARAGHGPLRRLRPHRCMDEARGIRLFGTTGIPSVELLAWGERRRRGLWDCGVLVTRFVEAPTAWEAMANRGELEPALAAARFIARVHRQGLVHGDAGLTNFLLAPDGLVTLDLCQAGRATPPKRAADVAQLAGSALAAGATPEQARACVDEYTRAAPGLPVEAAALWPEIRRRALDEVRFRFGASAIGGKHTHDALYDYLDGLAPAKVLDAPCGEGVIAEFLRVRGWDVHVADIDAGNMRVPRHRVTCVDLNRGTPFEDASFDVVVSANGLHRLFNPGGAIREFHRILRPGGRLVLNLNNYSSMDRRLRFLLQGSIDNAINSGSCRQTVEAPEAHVRVALMLPQVIGAMREAGFAIDLVGSGRRTIGQWALLPVAAAMSALGYFAGPRSRRRNELAVTNSMAVLGGGSYAVLVGRKRDA